MTLYSFSSTQAQRNIRRNRASLWPDGRRKSEDRLGALAMAQPEPTFTIDPSDKLMTIGSCFAREIEKFLASRGFDLPPLDVVVPDDERVSSSENDILNKYTVHSMENEIRWGGSDSGIAPEDFFLRATEDTWHDGQLVHNIKPGSLERVIERRKMVSAMMGRLAECRVTVITLGLVEAWYDTRTKLYLNGIPPTFAMKEEPDRFELRVLDFEEITAALERIHALHQSQGHPDFKILVTVSPVPFKATMTGRDALVANAYGKSVQRAAAEVFAARHDNVNYFPSYEIVTLSDRKFAYEDDNIHVTRPTVEHIMSTVMNAYVPGFEPPVKPAEKAAGDASEPSRPATAANMMAEALYSLKDGDTASAITSLTSLLYRFEHKLSAERAARAHSVLGTCFTRRKENAEALLHFEKARDLAPDNADIHFKCGLLLARLKKQDEALAAFRTAVEIGPDVAEHHHRLGLQLKVMGNLPEAISHLQAALSIDPDHSKAAEALRDISAVA